MSNTSSDRNKRKYILASLGGLLLVAAIAVAIAVPLSNREDESNLEKANRILESTPIVDGHNDLPYGIRMQYENQLSQVDLDSDLSDTFNTDIPRLKKGHVGGQFWSCFASCSSQYKDAIAIALQQIDLIKRFTNQYDDFEFVTTADGLKKAMEDGKIASMIGIEGGHMIDSSLAVLRMLYELGGRYMTLTHSCHTPWADTTSQEGFHGGLTGFGKKIVKEMNRLGMMVDLAHVSFDVMHDALDVSEAPVIFSHSSVYDVCNSSRNVPNDIIDRMPENGGIIMINFYTFYVSCERTATISDVADHFDFVKQRIGADYVGMGSDFDGVPSLPKNLTDVSMYPNLIAELLSRGWTEAEIKKISSENIIRVFKAVEEVADNSKLPDENWIPDEDRNPNNTCRSYNNPTRFID